MPWSSARAEIFLAQGRVVAGGGSSGPPADGEQLPDLDVVDAAAVGVAAEVRSPHRCQRLGEGGGRGRHLAAAGRLQRRSYLVERHSGRSVVVEPAGLFTLVVRCVPLGKVLRFLMPHDSWPRAERMF